MSKKIEISCVRCRRLFIPSNRKIKYCSRECYHGNNYDDTFLDNDSPFRSWFLGIFVTDGHYSKKRQIVIALNDKQIIDIITSNTNYKNKIIIRPAQGNWNATYRVSFSKKILKKIEEFGYFPGKKTGITFIPKCISDKTFGHFMRGVIEGDGCFRISNNKYLICEINSSSKLFLEEVLSRVRKLACVKSGTIKRGHCTYVLAFGHEDSVALGNYIYENSDELRLDRKYDIYLSKKDLELKAKSQKGLICKVDGCGKPAHCKNLCERHYHKLIKYPNYILKNKEKIFKKRKEYEEKNKEILVEKRKIYYQKNKEKILGRNRIYYNKNKASILKNRKRKPNNA